MATSDALLLFCYFGSNLSGFVIDATKSQNNKNWQASEQLVACSPGSVLRFDGRVGPMPVKTNHIWGSLLPRFTGCSIWYNTCDRTTDVKTNLGIFTQPP
jgi:hypothetical protein